MFAQISRFVGRKPDFTIGRVNDVYMRRWYVIPRNRWFNIYLHNMLRDDDEGALHDHPWWNVSIVLKGGYLEWMPRRKLPPSVLDDWAKVRTPSTQWYAKTRGQLVADNQRDIMAMWRRPGSIIFRRATDAHRLELDREFGPKIEPPLIPSWSLFITGPNKRTWGFWCKDGWKPHTEYIRKTATGNEVGAGCG